ncbi:Putative cytochrome P450 CYP13A7 [Leucoagaricus sp. SymC.cos]|nr:Putative cytochrome P450 CYP13A7 [Leucoagaricus sp. SymC.cos]
MPESSPLPAIPWSIYSSTLTFAISIAVISYITMRRKVLPGVPIPPSPSVLWGHERTIFQWPIGSWYGEWFDSIGPTYRIKAAGIDKDILVTVDPYAIHQMYTKNPYNYQHSSAFRKLISRILGRGLVWVEGQDDHRRMRSLVATAFNQDRIRAFLPHIWDTAGRLKDSLEKHISHRSGLNSSMAIIDLTHWTELTTLDVIGKVALGFDFQFGRTPEAKAIVKSWRDQVRFGMHHSAFYATVLLRTMPWLTSLPVTFMKTQGYDIKATVSRLARKLLDTAPGSLEWNRDLFSILFTAYKNQGTGHDISAQEAIEHIRLALFNYSHARMT